MIEIDLLAGGMLHFPAGRRWKKPLPAIKTSQTERMNVTLKSHAVKKRTKILLIVLLSLVVLAVAAVLIARGVARSFIQSEISTRSDWEIDTGDVADREASQQVTVYTDPVEASIQITQIVPDEYEDEGFTYYDENVQDRLAYTLLQLTQEGDYTLESPLAILNPFGTGSNGLYLYFRTDAPHPGDLHRGGGGLSQLLPPPPTTPGANGLQPCFRSSCSSAWCLERRTPSPCWQPPVRAGRDLLLYHRHA